jgi:hypothetical protein
VPNKNHLFNQQSIEAIQGNVTECADPIDTSMINTQIFGLFVNAERILERF